MFNRRSFLASAGMAALSACARPAPEPEPVAPPAPPPPPPMPARYGALYDEPFPVPAVPRGVVSREYWRQEIANPFTDMDEGGIVVDPDAAFLYLVEPNGRALRYGVSVGAAGFEWKGDAIIQYQRDWPVWKAPDSMVERWPQFEPYSVANGGMPGGPGNPLGARALYLFQNGEDTLYRIHGACEPETVGKAVSSGCIRMIDQDVIDLATRVRHHAPVRVLKSVKPEGLTGIY
ncbi:L,D-transpeptidase [Marivivens donghaensis]|uniref:L,D-transpeptidase n=1 Tax=Marivivens donghaensis TaxID=1699413 RepID=A0ABX0VUW5_9RHOB|nr:L,D-transpeptidase [Marivivens donghaensis]NIY71011.1 L,D-transpeptidase [Marivivens donghaensis]